jgi:hypothetical protein
MQFEIWVRRWAKDVVLGILGVLALDDGVMELFMRASESGLVHSDQWTAW